MYRRAASLLALVLVLGQFVPATLASGPVTVPNSMDNLLMTLEEAHIIDSAKTFRPQEGLTRAEALTLILRTSKVEPKDLAGMSAPWKDVAPTSWYNKQVQSATQLNIVSHQADDMFHPERAVTRGEFMTMLYRMDMTVTGKNSCCDGSEIKYQDLKPWDWFFTPAVWARNTFLMDSGVEDMDPGFRNYIPAADFKGNEAITREEAATILYMYHETFMDEMTTEPFGYLSVTSGQGCGGGYDAPSDQVTWTTTFTGEAPKSLPATGAVYKEVESQDMGIDVDMPEMLRKQVPALGEKGLLTNLSITSKKWPSLTVTSYEPQNSISLSWNASAEEPAIRVAAETGSVMRAGANIVRRLGIDASKFGTAEVSSLDGTYSSPTVSYHTTMDGLPIYDEYGNHYSGLTINLSTPDATYFSVNMDFMHPMISATYNLTSWDEVLELLTEHDHAASQSVYLDGNTYTTYDDEGNAVNYNLKSVETNYTSAKEVMVRFNHTVVQNDGGMGGATFYMPSIQFDGTVTGVTMDGQRIDLGAASTYVARSYYPDDAGEIETDTGSNMEMSQQ